MKTILVFAYYSFKDPVFQSAVLPYLNPPASKSPTFRFILLTWEQQSYSLNDDEIVSIDSDLKKNNILWYRLKWHSGRFKMIKKIYDFFLAMTFGVYLILKHKASAIYSEGFPGAILGDFLSRLTKRPHIVHTFEPHAAYMLETGVWANQSWEYRVLSFLEISIGKRAYAIITATEQYKIILQQRGVRSTIFALGSCIDLNHFKFDKNERLRIRSEQGITDKHIVITYLGKIGGMYMSDELFEFFSSCQNLDPDRFVFFVLTGSELKSFEHLIVSNHLNKDRMLIKTLQTHEVPAYLSASDVGFIAITPVPSKRFCSPIKTGELLACGLPVVIPEGISDDYLGVKENDIGVVYSREEGVKVAAKKMMEYIESHDVDTVQVAARQFAVLNRNVEMGRELLWDIFERV